jgi:hypothetical protein
MLPTFMRSSVWCLKSTVAHFVFAQDCLASSDCDMNSSYQRCTVRIMRKHLVVFAQPRTSDEVQEGAFRRLLNSSGGPNLHRTHIKQLCISRGQNDEGRHNHRPLDIPKRCLPHVGQRVLTASGPLLQCSLDLLVAQRSTIPACESLGVLPSSVAETDKHERPQTRRPRMQASIKNTRSSLNHHTCTYDLPMNSLLLGAVRNGKGSRRQCERVDTLYGRGMDAEPFQDVGK